MLQTTINVLIVKNFIVLSMFDIKKPRNVSFLTFLFVDFEKLYNFLSLNLRKSNMSLFFSVTTL